MDLDNEMVVWKGGEARQRAEELGRQISGIVEGSKGQESRQVIKRVSRVTVSGLVNRRSNNIDNILSTSLLFNFIQNVDVNII